MHRARRQILFRSSLVVAALGMAGAVFAQIGGEDRGIAPLDSSGSFEVSGVSVDVSAKTADAARYGGWRLAQRKGWQTLSRRLGGDGALIPDATLDGIVSGIIVENEKIGPDRYVARLGVLFSRARAASILGVSAGVPRSPPMLVVPILWSGGAGQVFERRTEWQQAWARFRTGNSTIDYVRATGTGPDPLLINAGLVGRPGRGWWRTVLSQYGALNVLIPVARLYRQYPGGPVIGVFQARYGPDNRLLGVFTLRVNNSDALPALLDAGIKRIDDSYQRALAAGVLGSDASLTAPPPWAKSEEEPIDEGLIAGEEGIVTTGNAISTLIVQFDTPGAGAVTSTEGAVKSVPGVRSAVTTSLALGGVSVMRVVYDGDATSFGAALQARGWQVVAGTGAIRIQRPSGGTPSVPPPDNATGG